MVLLQCYLTIAAIIYIWTHIIPRGAYLIMSFGNDEELVSRLLPHYAYGFSKKSSNTHTQTLVLSLLSAKFLSSIISLFAG